MKDLIQCEVCGDDLQRWLDSEAAPYEKRGGSDTLTVLLKLEKTKDVDYLYRNIAVWDSGISWDNDLIFCGVYDERLGMLN